MKITTIYNDINYEVDLHEPIDISIPIGQVRCFYSTNFEKTPYKNGNFIGSVKHGAPVNFFDIKLNPHGNGTHTECLGHITLKQESINSQLKNFHFISRLISVNPEKKKNGDRFISKKSLSQLKNQDWPEALIIRTKPNIQSKLTKDYSGTNPPYIDPKAMEFIVQKGIKHLLLDLPSVDKEVDGGKLKAHHLFWNVQNYKAKTKSRSDATITEMIYVPSTIKDGLFLLNIQIPSLNLDAAPSKPVIYSLKQIKLAK